MSSSLLPMNALFKKLNFKNQDTCYILNAPFSLGTHLEEMKAATTIKTSLAGARQVEFFLAFVTQQKEVDDFVKKVVPLLAHDGLLWFAYPKGTSKKYVCGFNRDTGWQALGNAGYEPVRMVAVDEDWSALRFRNAENIRKMTRSFAMLETGKKKVAAAKKKK